MQDEFPDGPPDPDIVMPIRLTLEEIGIHNLAVTFLHAARQVAGSHPSPAPAPVLIPADNTAPVAVALSADIVWELMRRNMEDTSTDHPSNHSLGQHAKTQLFEDLERSVLQAYVRHGGHQAAALMPKIDDYPACEKSARTLGMLAFAQLIKQAGKAAPG